MDSVKLKGANSTYYYFPDEVSTVLYRGRNSVIYLAVDYLTNEKVVCKKIPPAKYINEVTGMKFFIEASTRMRHKGIVNTRDIVVTDDCIFIVQDFILGLSLKELIADKRFLSYKNNNFFYKVIVSFLDIMAYVHSNKLYLYDVKPSNIIVADTGDGIDIDHPDVRLVDLLSVKPQFSVDLLRTGDRQYNILYASPEQLLGFSEMTGDYSDIYSAGLLLYEAIAKEPALDIHQPQFLRRMQLTVPIKQHYRLDDDVFQIITKATVKPHLTKHERLYTTAELQAELLLALNARFRSAEQFMLVLSSLIR